jgi:hypothetical protein
LSTRRKWWRVYQLVWASLRELHQEARCRYSFATICCRTPIDPDAAGVRYSNSEPRRALLGEAYGKTLQVIGRLLEMIAI